MSSILGLGSKILKTMQHEKKKKDFYNACEMS